MRTGRDRGGHLLRRCAEHLNVADRADRRMVAGAHAGRTHDADVGARRAGEVIQKVLGPAIAQDSESQTRTVTGGGGASPSFTTSKWA